MRVAIIGCGYVGLALSEKLQEAGATVIGVQRSVGGKLATKATGAEGITADVTEPESLSSIPSVDVIVYAVSAGGGDLDQARAVYIDGLRNVITEFGQREDPPSRLVYTSSTGVLGDHDGEWVNESAERKPGSEKAEILCSAEDIALELSREHGLSPLITRLGGIYGPHRYRLDRYLEKPITPGYRNLIHREDVAGAINHLIQSGDFDHECIHVTDMEPVDRYEFATWLAEQLDTEPPQVVTLEERIESGELSETARARLAAAKRVDNSRLVESGYEFRFPTFREGYSAEIARRRHGS